VSLALLVSALVAVVVAGCFLMDSFHASSGVSALAAFTQSSLAGGGNTCPAVWCQAHGYTEDKCNCGVCGSFGMCTWTCNPKMTKPKFPLMSCKSGPSWLLIFGLGFVILVVIIVITVLIYKKCCSNKPLQASRAVNGNSPKSLEKATGVPKVEDKAKATGVPKAEDKAKAMGVPKAEDKTEDNAEDKVAVEVGTPYTVVMAKVEDASVQVEEAPVKVEEAPVKVEDKEPATNTHHEKEQSVAPKKQEDKAPESPAPPVKQQSAAKIKALAILEEENYRRQKEETKAAVERERREVLTARSDRELSAKKNREELQQLEKEVQRLQEEKAAELKRKDREFREHKAAAEKARQEKQKHEEALKVEREAAAKRVAKEAAKREEEERMAKETADQVAQAMPTPERRAFAEKMAIFGDKVQRPSKDSVSPRREAAKKMPAQFSIATEDSGMGRQTSPSQISVTSDISEL